MRAKVIATGAMLGAAALVGGGATAAAHAAAPDPYSPAVQTSCRVQVPRAVEPGERVVVKVTVKANSPSRPTGTIRLDIDSSGGRAVWSRAVDYNGGTKQVLGPALAKGGYEVSARFQSGDDTFAKCRGSVAFDVAALGGGGGGDDDDDGIGGLLPDTGGPALLWLLLGLGLVGGGTATVVYSRRRSAPATV